MEYDYFNEKKIEQIGENVLKRNFLNKIKNSNTWKDI